jgi:transcriptional repressor NrdR
MYCPFCGHEETKVNDSRLAGEGRQIRRRRECLKCGERFTTFETAELLMPMIVKGDRARQAFDEGKLRAGMEKALEKRPVAREQLDEAVSRIVHAVRSLGDREVSSRAIGELVMEELRHLDEVAYVRFASRLSTTRSSGCAAPAAPYRSAACRRRRTSAGRRALPTATSCRCCRWSRPTMTGSRAPAASRNKSGRRVVGSDDVL